jgi:hypothetical protein
MKRSLSGRSLLFVLAFTIAILASCSKVEISVGNLHGGTQKYWRVISTVVNNKTYAPIACEASKRVLFKVNGDVEILNNKTTLCSDVPTGLDSLYLPPDTFLVEPYKWVYNPNGNRLSITNEAGDTSFNYTVTELSKNQMVLVVKQNPNSASITYQSDNR